MFWGKQTVRKRSPLRVVKRYEQLNEYFHDHCKQQAVPRNLIGTEYPYACASPSDIQHELSNRIVFCYADSKFKDMDDWRLLDMFEDVILTDPEEK